MEMRDHPVMTRLVQTGLFGEENYIRGRGFQATVCDRPITGILRFATNALCSGSR
jgi:hypothetical protein